MLWLFHPIFIIIHSIPRYSCYCCYSLVALTVKLSECLGYFQRLISFFPIIFQHLKIIWSWKHLRFIIRFQANVLCSIHALELFLSNRFIEVIMINTIAVRVIFIFLWLRFLIQIRDMSTQRMTPCWFHFFFNILIV